ncbi:LysM peptidoglycan-binding domain-containing protein [Halomonas alkalicola]|uniref:LysM peptidoglycan-binding domain-containing protein n=1 Tax=Halomonas alkalicola TaxID=1930622 RepID=A0ABY9H522_9GAMM|nr:MULTISPECIES: LysM peptidoglycan-binding domain-containing protein [Halomonas]QJQ99166.1 LysM peptidoglycan-binding domain-containing protein [Halomonas sp. PGE1]WLI73561.1 LysM peptidoglycan-binding domain-containing protein [Halomonas alkalicola]
MAQRPVAGKGRLALALMLAALLLGGCASRPDAPDSARTNATAESGGWVVVQRGDTLGEIARRGQVPLERLQRFNPDVDPRRLAVGQRLLMPTQQERAPSGGPYRYQVRPGDTYSSIARRFGTRASRIQAANPGVQPTALRVGQLIQVPLAGGASAGASRPAQAGSSGSGGAAAPARASLPDPGNLPSSARNWPWPLEDYRIVRAFGADSRGTLQPMLLATGRGARARAVADGEVRFADSMRQLGQVVIVHHADNLQSVYALCETTLVANGARVSRGDPLCEVGYSSTSERHDLLFDLRHGGKPIDPRRVLR